MFGQSLLVELKVFDSSMEKPSPITRSGTKSHIDLISRLVQVFHRHGDRSPLKNYCQGTEQEQAEIDTWKPLVG